MPEFVVSVRVQAVDETSAATEAARRAVEALGTSAQTTQRATENMGSGTAATMKGKVVPAAQEAQKEIEKIGPAAQKAEQQSKGPLDGIKNALGEVVKIAAGFTLAQLGTQLGQGLASQIKQSVSAAQEFQGQVRGLQMMTGATAEDISGIVAAFGRFGVSSQQASTSLGIFSKQMTKVPLDADEAASGLDDAGKELKGFSAAMADLGVHYTDTSGNQRQMIDVLMDTADSFKAMGQSTEATSTAMTLFGRSGRAMLPVLMQGSEGIKATAEQAAKMGLTLTTDNMAAIRSYSMAQKDMNEALQGLRLQIGVAVMPILAEFAKLAVQLAVMLNQNLMPVVKALGEFFGTTLGPAIGIVFGALTNIVGIAVQVIGWFARLGIVVETFKAVLTVLAPVLVGVGLVLAGHVIYTQALVLWQTIHTTVITTAKAAWIALNAVMAANPILWVVIGIGLLIGALILVYQKSESFRNMVNSVWERIKLFGEGIRDIWNAVVEAFTGDAGALGVVYDVIRKLFGDTVAEFFQPFLQFVMDMIPRVKEIFAGLKEIWSALVEAFTGDVGALGVVYDVIRKLFGDSVAEAFQPFLQILMELIPIVKEFFGAIGDAFGKLFAGDFGGFLKGIGSAFGNLFKGAAPLLLRGAEELQGVLWSLGTKAIGAIFQGLMSAFPMLEGPIRTLWELFDNAWDFINRIIGNKIGMIKAIFTGDWAMLWELAKDTFWAFVNHAMNLVNILGRALVDWIWPAIQEIPGLLAEFAGFILGWIVEMVPQLVDKLIEWSYAFMGWVTPLLVELAFKLAEIIGFVVGWIIGVAPQVLETLGEWAAAFGQWVANVAQALPGQLWSIATALWDWIRGAGKQSAEEGGGEIGKSLFQGIKDWVLGAAPALGKFVLDAVKGGLGFLGGVVEKFAGGFEAGRSAASSAGSDLMGDVTAGVMGGEAAAYDAASEAAQAMIGALSTSMEEANLPAEMVNAGNAMIEGLTEGLDSGSPEAIAAAVTTANLLVSEMNAVLGVASPSTVMAESGAAMVEGLVLGISTSADVATNAMQVLVGAITAGSTAIVSLGAMLTESGSAIAECLGVGIPNAAQVTAQAMQMLVEALSASVNAMAALAVTMHEIGMALVHGLASGITASIPLVEAAMTQMCAALVDTITTYLGLGGGTSTVMRGLGQDTMKGFIDGMDAIASGIGAWIQKNVTDAIPGFMKQFLGISSPSTVMRGVGESTMQGFLDGLQAKMPEIQGFLSSLGGLMGGGISGPASITGATGEIADYIRQAAALRGIDPEVAIRVAQSEGGVTEYNKRGTFATGSSWWPFQLHYGGAGTPYAHFGTTAGMGNSFSAATGFEPGDPTAWKASIDYALDEVARTGWGKWYGAAAAGIGNMQGISQNATARRLDQGGWLTEPVIGVGPSGTRYQMHAQEYVAPAGPRAAAAAGGFGGGGGITLNVAAGAVQISGTSSARDDIASAADLLWDDLYAKLARAMSNRARGVGATP